MDPFDSASQDHGLLSPVDDLQARRTAGGYQLTWTPPEHGEVLLFATSSAFGGPTDDLIPFSRLKELGDAVAVTGERTTVYEPASDANGDLWIFPVTALGESALIGTSIRLEITGDAPSFSGKRDGSSLHLEWEWSDGCKRALVGFRHDRFPNDPEEDRSIRKYITREEYNRYNAYRIIKADKKDYLFTLWMVDDRGDQTMYSTGRTLSIPFVVVPEIHHRRRLHQGLLGRIKDVSIFLWKQGDPVMLPETVLVCKEEEEPRSIDDGQVSFTIPSETPLDAQPLHIELDPSGWTDKTHYRLFFKDSDQDQKMRFVAKS